MWATLYNILHIRYSMTILIGYFEDIEIKE